MPLPLPTIPTPPPPIIDPNLPRCPKCGKIKGDKCDKSNCPMKEEEPMKNIEKTNQNNVNVRPMETEEKKVSLPPLETKDSYGLCHECGKRYEGTPQNCGKKECPY